MKKSKNEHLPDNKEAHSKLMRLLEENTPEERSKLLNDIDGILCNLFELKIEDLPWLNPNKHTEKWENIMSNLRLVVAKLEYESKQKIKTIH